MNVVGKVGNNPHIIKLEGSIHKNTGEEKVVGISIMLDIGMYISLST